MPSIKQLPTVSVVICAYTADRWEDLAAATASIRAQTQPAHEIIVVIDHNPQLLQRVQAAMPDVLVLANKGSSGAGESRNTGVEAASGSLIAFLDDDAVARADWLERATEAFRDSRVLGVGGTIDPAWEENEPRWMAREFWWTVGCTYPGLPTSPAPVRNLIATNMFLRRDDFIALNGFRAGFGKTGARSGTEETDFCIRAGQRWPDRFWLYDPAVAVTHKVPAARSRLRYFVSRCFDEGMAKASIVRFVGWTDGLAAERRYTMRTLPKSFAAGLWNTARHGDPAGLARSSSIVIGLAATSFGYMAGQRKRSDQDAGRTHRVFRFSRKASPSRSREGVVVVGSGTRFISGVSHYTRYVAVALAERRATSAILMRQLIPRRFYPGRARVGSELTDEQYPADLPVFDGVDWYWIPSILRAARFLRRRRPEAVLFQWWTGAVLHTYVLLALMSRSLGAQILIEIHEIQDTGEAKLQPARLYVRWFGRLLMGMADGCLVHSEHDRAAVRKSFGVSDQRTRVVRHGPFSHYAVSGATPRREAPEGAWNVFFFGTIRPYKGLEDLVIAFEQLAEEDGRWWLTVVGETWEGWTEPLTLIDRSPVRDRITLVNHYVSDAEASEWFRGADIVALPYRRSSASGPLHLSMDAGLPVVVTGVGGLREATEHYEGAVLVPPADPGALADGLRKGIAMRGETFQDAGSWDRNAEAVIELIDRAGSAVDIAA